MMSSSIERIVYQLGYLALAGLVFAFLLHRLYLAALPKPIPGIPYNYEASKLLFGDVKEMLAAKYRRVWLWTQPKKHNSPLAQVFLFPLRKPTVIVSDYREIVDICTRRTSEFDRGTRNKECVGLTAPNFHFTMESKNPKFKAHRELLRDIMTPSFLEEVAAPRIYDRASLLINLWEMKRQKSQDHPFAAGNDLYLATMDIICSVAFGMEREKTALQHEITNLESQNPIPPRSKQDPVEFKYAPLDAELEAILDIPEMLAIAQRSPMPTLAQHLALLKPKHARAQWNRRALVRRQTKRSLENLAAEGFSSRESALDHLLWRELNAAQKAERKPDLYSTAIRDELLGFLLAGHDTTATSLAWWVKYMATHQETQRRLRSEIKGAFPEATKEQRWPTHSEIASCNIPFLNAVVEETLRYASVATLIVRRSTCNTQILGYHIPKGTDLLLPLTGPSMTQLGQVIPESLRSDACREAKERVPAWGDDVQEFRPERWLKIERDEDGVEREVFDARAGPNLAFSVGPRQCFGKRLGYLQLKMVMILLSWNHSFQELSDEINGSEMVERLVNLPKHCFIRLGKSE